MLASYRFALEDSQPQPIGIFLPHVLDVMDVAWILALCAPAPVFLVNPVGYGRRALSAQTAASEFGVAAAVYDFVGAPEALGVQRLAEPAGAVGRFLTTGSPGPGTGAAP
jgi:hypothetical protein